MLMMQHKYGLFVDETEQLLTVVGQFSVPSPFPLVDCMVKHQNRVFEGKGEKLLRLF